MTEKFKHPKAVRRLPNGTEVDAQGHFLTGPDPKESPIQSSEDARALALRKHALARERAREGLEAAARERGLSVANASEAWREVIKVRSEVALEDRKRDGTEATRLVGQATGYLSRDEDDASEGERARISVRDVDALIELAAKIDEEIERRVGRALAVDAQVEDTD